MKALVVEAEWAPREGYPLTLRERDQRRAIIGSQVWRHPTWQVAERSTPEVTKPDEVLVRVRACGVCGADVHMWETDPDGYLLLAYRTRMPLCIGHEFCGEVAEVGSAVSAVQVGEAVAIEGMGCCGRCRACKRGLVNCCPDGEDLGFTRDGGAAEYVLAREAQCCSLESLRDRCSEEKLFEIGAMIEPTSVVYHGMFVRAEGVRPGDDVAVFGCGPIGLAAVALARAAGAAAVIAVDTQAERRDLARSCGAGLALDPAVDDIVGEVMHATRGRGAGTIVEASGAGRAVFPHIDRCLDFGAQVVVLGVDPRPAPIDLVAYQAKAARIYGSLGHLGGGFDAAIDLHARGLIDMSAIVTGRVALEDGVAAIERTARRVDAKVLIIP